VNGLILSIVGHLCYPTLFKNCFQAYSGFLGPGNVLFGFGAKRLKKKTVMILGEEIARLSVKVFPRLP
jgi:hypothetical protein